MTHVIEPMPGEPFAAADVALSPGEQHYLMVVGRGNGWIDNPYLKNGQSHGRDWALAVKRGAPVTWEDVEIGWICILPYSPAWNSSADGFAIEWLDNNDAVIQYEVIPHDSPALQQWLEGNNA